MADIGDLPVPGQTPWNLNPAILAMNAELNGRLSETSLEETILLPSKRFAIVASLMFGDF